MPCFFNINDFDLGEPSYSGHEVYPNGIYKNSKVIFKKNKFGKPDYSIKEVVFSNLARLFLEKNSTSKVRLVKDNDAAIVGIAVPHLCYSIEKKEGLETPFYVLKNLQNPRHFTSIQVTKPEEIPYYFFDKLPHGYFADLVQAEKKGFLSLDYDSLANIFTGSYTLEEDDLHKGNFGFYITENNGKPKVSFFKIDHDLMFVDSIMSFFTLRIYHWFHKESAFDIIAKDLLDFPNLSHSANSYWPAKNSFFANPFESKDYNDSEEIDAFARLGHVPAFKKAKWMSFYKHIILPYELIEQAISENFDINEEYDRAQIALIAQAVVARQAQLRAVLFSIKDFRDFVRDLSSESRNSLEKELAEEAPDLSEKISATFDQYHFLCSSSNGFQENDTPLHAAIRLGDYRYVETLRMFGQHINDKNKAGERPLDVALKMHNSGKHHVDDIRKDARFTMRHLLEHGAKMTTQFEQFNRKEHVESYTHKTDYISKSSKASGYKEFKAILRDIGEDHQFCLKFKKNLAIECISTFIESHQKDPKLKKILVELKKDINGLSSEEESAGLLFIRQLRSKLWFVRQIRGLYGLTSTQSEINRIIDNEIGRLTPKKPNSFSFFLSNWSTDQVIEPVINSIVLHLSS